MVRRTAVVPFHGATAGFVVNYSPDHAVRFNLSGAPVAVLDREYRPGRVMVSTGGKAMPAGEFARVVGLAAGRVSAE